MKITTSTDIIKFFGGLNFISVEFDRLQLPSLITQHFGERSLLLSNVNPTIKAVKGIPDNLRPLQGID